MVQNNLTKSALYLFVTVIRETSLLAVCGLPRLTLDTVGNNGVKVKITVPTIIERIIISNSRLQKMQKSLLCYVQMM